jgi:hypothetical protein
MVSSFAQLTFTLNIGLLFNPGLLAYDRPYTRHEAQGDQAQGYPPHVISSSQGLGTGGDGGSPGQKRVGSTRGLR